MPTDDDEIVDTRHEKLIKQIIGLEREYFFEKRNVKTERQRKLRELIERFTIQSGDDDT